MVDGESDGEAFEVEATAVAKRDVLDRAWANSDLVLLSSARRVATSSRSTVSAELAESRASSR